MNTADRLSGGNLPRRACLNRLALVAGGSAVALACGSEATAIAPAPTTAPSSPTSRPADVPAATVGDSIEAGSIEFDTDWETLLGYLSRSTLTGPHSAIVVVHENRGCSPISTTSLAATPGKCTSP